MPYKWDGVKTFNMITKVQGDPLRHIEQIWDEIKKLKENIVNMKRERLEDLGRLAVMLDNITKNEIFQMYTGRTKDFTSWFYEKSEDYQHDFLHDLIYRLEALNADACECWHVANGKIED